MTRSPTATFDAGGPRPDQEILDEIFERALESLERGDRLMVSELARGHEELRAEIERLVELAERVAIVRPQGWPTVPGYTILGELGRGGMGAVYLARQERLGGRPVALKVLPAGFALSARSRERFMLEARAVARLRHPNIVAIHDVVDTTQIAAFAMEWVEGTSLSQLIDHRRSQAMSGTASGPVDPLSVVRTGVDVGRALHAVHEAGLLHRDVKPSNILLRTDGTPLLSDFGLVREEGSAVHTVSGQFVGTPIFAAPEQLRGQRTLGPAADVYALGATLYHAATLERPHEDAAIPSILERVEHNRIPPPRRINPRLPRDLETIIAKAMEADPARRYPSAAELADDLERLSTLRPIRAKPSGLVTRSAKLVRRNRGRIVGGAVGGALAMALAAALVFVLFIAPRWHSKLVLDARVQLIGDGFHNGLFNTVYAGVKVGGAYDPRVAEAEFLRVIESGYTRAMRLPVSAPSEVAQERDVVRLALAVGEGNARRIDSIGAPFPLTLRAARSWASREVFPAIDDAELDDAAPGDLRSLGLLDLLCGTGGAYAARAWSRLDTDADQDPVVEHTLGYLYLLLDRPAVAYPRLRASSEAFPNIGFVHAFVADAAIKVGDLDRAERIIAQVREMPKQDLMAGTLRVRIELLIAQGRHDEAVALARTYDQRYRGNPPARTSLARSFAARGEHELAFREMLGWELSTLEHGFNKLRELGFKAFLGYELDLIEIGDRWWASLDERQRGAWIDRASQGDTYERFALARYLRAVETVRDWPPIVPIRLLGASSPTPPGSSAASDLSLAARPFHIPAP